MAIIIEIEGDVIGRHNESGSKFPQKSKLTDVILAKSLVDILGENLYQRIASTRKGNWTLGDLSTQVRGCYLTNLGFTPEEEDLLIRTAKELRELEYTTGAIATHGGVSAGAGGIAVGGNVGSITFSKK